MNEEIVFKHPISLGLKAKILRISRCMSQEQTAELACVSQETVSRFERNLFVSSDAKQRIMSILDSSSLCRGNNEPDVR